MIEIHQEKVDDVPLLHIVKQNLYEEELPCVIFNHGFTSAKEHNLHIAYYLAEKNIRVILPDAMYHGEREEGLSSDQISLMFWDIVIKQIEDLGKIKNHYVGIGLIDENRIAVSGTSMGGIITFGALTQYTWIKAGASLMGAAFYCDLANEQLNNLNVTRSNINVHELKGKIEKLKYFDLTSQLDKIKKTPIFMWHGKNDTVVPYKYSEKLYELLKQQGRDVYFLSEDGIEHKVSRLAVVKLVSWLEKELTK
jgi:uncharacterized protein